MEYRFANMFLDQKDLLSQHQYEINPFLLENNESQLKKIFEFYINEDSDILFANGFLGTGKAEIVKYSTAYLSDEVIVLKYNCFNSTILDDILLAFFKEFRELAKQGSITDPRLKTDNFTEKINSYFSQINRPFLVILDSFEAILDENRQEILDFIFHIISMKKTKVIIIGRSYESKFFEGHNVSRFTTLALDRKIFDRYLKEEKVKAGNPIIEDFYKHTRGYFYYTALSAKIIKAQDINLEMFLDKLKDSYMPFNKLLEKELLSLIPPDEVHLFWFLTLVRHDINIELLKKLELYDKEKLDELINNKIVVQEGENFYIQDYFDEITDIAPQNLLQRLRQYLVDIYQSQLPLKPFERDICISRQTMRKEIEYHKLFLPKRPVALDNKPTDINYLSYSKVFSPQNNQQQQPIYERGTPRQESTLMTSGIDLTQRKNVSLNISNFSTSNTSQSNVPAQSYTQPVAKDPQEKEEKLSFKNLISLIKKAEKVYEYNEVLSFALQALAMKQDPQYSEMLPFIYAKMANAYTKTAQHEKALSYYYLLEQMYSDDAEKVSQIRIKIANIYYETYKFDQAKELYESIVKTQDAPSQTVLNSYLKLINIAEEQNYAEDEKLSYFNAAIEISKDVTNEKTLAELYFKYAIALDDQDNIKGSIEYYKKCIEINDTTENKYLSSSYANLAGLYLEDNNHEKAVEYFVKAYEADRESENFEGAYDSATRLANMLKRKDPQRAIEYFKGSIKYAKLTKDVYYTISALVEMGDFNYENKKDELALKNYVQAFNLAQEKALKDQTDRIKIRLNDVKFRLGEQTYNSLIEIIESQRNEEDE